MKKVISNFEAAMNRHEDNFKAHAEEWIAKQLRAARLKLLPLENRVRRALFGQSIMATRKEGGV